MFPEQRSPWSPALITGVISVITETMEDRDTACPFQRLELHMSKMTMEAKNEVILD